MGIFKKVNKKVLHYESGLEFFPDFIVPIKKHIPKWYKDTEPWIGGKPNLTTKGIKKCIPFLDSLTVGYCIQTPIDLVVSLDNGLPLITWRSEVMQNIVETRPNPQNIPTPAGMHSLGFMWNIWGGIKLPKGYSAVFTHPLNRIDLPFFTLSGVVDDYEMGPGSMPFYLKEGWEGVIPQGTPIVQIIPFKRENWSSRVLPGLYAASKLRMTKARAVLSDYYKKHDWKKKSYE